MVATHLKISCLLLSSGSFAIFQVEGTFGSFKATNFLEHSKDKVEDDKDIAVRKLTKSGPDKIIEHKFIAEGRCDRIGVFAISRFESRELLVT